MSKISGYIRSVLHASLVGMILLLLTSLVQADVVNLSLSIPEADSTVFEFGQPVRLVLRLTDQDGDTLRADDYQQNSLTLIELYVSGPRQEFHGVEGFTPLRILSTQEGFDEEAGFNPETGEIEVSVQDEAGVGSYTALFKVTRRVANQNTTRYAQKDFRLGSLRPTRTPSVRWFNCNSCHNPSRHGTNVLANCVVCHAKDFAAPFQSIIHEIGPHPQDRNRCTNCHKAGAGLASIKRTACFTCHNEPQDHNNRQDDQCAGCHQGNNSPYARHQIAVPTQPFEFDLINPQDGAELDSGRIRFDWEASRDNDANDMIFYELEVADNEEFLGGFWIDTLTRPGFTLSLPTGAEYYWRVRAADLNSEGRYSSSTRSFSIIDSIPPEPPPNEPPSQFQLTLPVNGARLLDFIHGSEVHFEWEESIDPDSGAIVSYQIYGYLVLPGFATDSLLFHQFLEDRLYRYDVDSLQRTLGVGHYEFNWEVYAISQGDTIPCESSFMFTMDYESYAHDDELFLPNSLALLMPHPNPFNSVTTIEYFLPVSSEIELAVYDQAGRPVEVLDKGKRNAGRFSLIWHADGLSAGVYLVRFQSGSVAQIQKVVLLR